MDNGGTIRQILDHVMNPPEKGTPSLWLVLLSRTILLLQRQIGGDIHGCVAGHPVAVPCGQVQGVDVQVVQHLFNRNLGIKFLEDKNFLPMVGIKRDPLGGPVVCDPANILSGVFVEDTARFAGTAGTV